MGGWEEEGEGERLGEEGKRGKGEKGERERGRGREKGRGKEGGKGEGREREERGDRFVKFWFFILIFSFRNYKKLRKLILVNIKFWEYI